MNFSSATIVAAAGLAAVFCASCSFLPSEPYREVRSYDLGVPAAAAPVAPVSVQPFSADSACKFKLLYRAGGNEMLIDEYNKWTQPPGQMLTKYMRLAFRSEPGEAGKRPETEKYELSGSILAFEADLDAKKANLGVRYSLSSKNDPELRLDRTAIFSEELKGSSPADVAAAMEKAANQLVASVKSDIAALEASSLKKEPSKQASQ
jgi:ABC-type uncharacterized transport system auxiliary subunit